MTIAAGQFGKLPCWVANAFTFDSFFLLWQRQPRHLEYAGGTLCEQPCDPHIDGRASPFGPLIDGKTNIVTTLQHLCEAALATMAGASLRNMRDYVSRSPMRTRVRQGMAALASDLDRMLIKSGGRKMRHAEEESEASLPQIG